MLIIFDKPRPKSDQTTDEAFRSVILSLIYALVVELIFLVWVYKNLY